MAGSLLRRGAALAVTALVLYGVAPALGQVLGTWDEVARLSPVWLVALVVAQIASLWCLWELQAIAIGTHELGAVATSQLAGGAVGRIVPGGAATAGAVQYGMLATHGIRRSDAAVGLAASSIILVAALCVLPLLAVPAIVLGMRVPTTLWHAAVAGGLLFLLLLGVSLAALRSERTLLRIGELVRDVVVRLRRHAPVPTDLPERILARRDELAGRLGERFPRAAAAALGRWMLDLGCLLAALAAVDARPRLSLVVLAYVAAQLLAQVPLTPGGIGLVEAGLVALLALIGVPGPAAAVATLAYRLVSYWLPLPAGGIAYVVHRRRVAVAGGEPEPL
ncbi:MAG: flippase-like domain-containing protein [Solirubrobacterales bacterium]|nr:flippase-like domain-containing protein [Solirubrobacterales bacterium]